MTMSFLQKIWMRVYPPRHALFFMQRLVMEPSIRLRLARMFAKRLPPQSDDYRGDFRKDVVLLKESGFVMIPDLVTPVEVQEVCNWLEGKSVYDRWKPGAGQFEANQPPPDCHTAPYLDSDVVNCPHALRWANDPRVLSIVGQALGAKPTLSNLTIWWSYPGHDTPQEAESFHRDVDDLHFIKLFIYLTDVDDGCGPHAFVPGSQADSKLTRIRRYRDEEVLAAFGAGSIKYFVGEKGTSFLENTFGLHKGQLPANSRRLLFQAQYSLHPIGIYSYSPVEKNIATDIQVDPYINRLYVK